MLNNQMIKFPSIRQFREIRRDVEWKAQYKGLDDNNEPIMDRLAKLPTLTFEGTVKLHGCNSSIVINPDLSFYCQSRERIITPESNVTDNYGFARFINELPKEVISHLYSEIIRRGEEKPVVIYGEWAGKGIQQGVAINNIERSWFIFGAKIINEENLDEENWQCFIGGQKLENKIFNIINFPVYHVNIDFEKPELSINELNDITLKVEEQCPVAKKFDLEGIGEGVVWKCITPGYNSDRFWFKVKGDKHSSSNVKKLATVDPEKLDNIYKFIDNSVNEERLNQAWEKIKEGRESISQKETGDFIRLVFNDILKEESDVMETNGIKEKEIGGPIAKRAKIWFFEKLNNPQVI